MAGALSWTLGLKDGMSGPGAAMGGVLTTIAGKLRDAGAAAAAFQKKQEDALRANIGRAEIAKLNARNKEQESGAKSEFLANMSRYDTIRDDLAAQNAKEAAAALRQQKEAAVEAARAMDRLRAASRAAAANPYNAGQAVMGKTGANVPGVVAGQGQLSTFASIINKLNAIHPAAGRAALGLAAFAARADNATQSVGGLEGIAGRAGSALLSVGAFALKAGAYVAGALAGVGVLAAKWISEIQSFKSSSLFAFGALLGGADQAAAAWDKVKAVSLSTGTDLLDTGKAFNSLLAQSFSLDEVDTLVRRMADLKTLNPAANIDGIARAISQIKSTGKLQGDELMQLNEAGLSSKLVYEELARSLGKTVPEIQKMQKAGEITDKMAIDAIQKAIARQTGDRAPGALAAEAASKTLSGSIGKMYAAVQVWASGLNIDFSSIGRFADRLGRVLSGDSGKRLGNSIENAFAKALGILDTMSEKDIAAGFDTAAGLIDSFAAGAENAAGAIRTVDGWVSSVTTKTSAWGLVFEVVAAGLFGVIDAFKLVGSYISGFWSMMAEAVMAPIRAIDALIAKLSSVPSAVPSSLGLSNALGAAPGSDAKGSQESSASQSDMLAEAIRKATQPATPQAGQPGAPAAPSATTSSPAEAKPANTTNNITVTANGLTFADFEQRVAEIVRKELDKG